MSIENTQELLKAHQEANASLEALKKVVAENRKLKEQIQYANIDDNQYNSMLKSANFNPTNGMIPVQSSANPTALNSLRFNNCLKYIYSVEGRYSNDAGDPGGATAWGIIQSEARSFGYKGDMKNMPQALAQRIYYTKYYRGFNIDKLNSDAVAYKIFDWCVNSGRASSQIKAKLSQAYGVSFPSGNTNKFTEQDITIINSLVKTKDDEAKIVKLIENTQRNYYKGIGVYKTFGKGLENRVDKNIAFISTNTGLNLNNQNFINASLNIQKNQNNKIVLNKKNVKTLNNLQAKSKNNKKSNIKSL